MKNKVVWFVVFNVASLITNMAVQFFWKGTVNPGQVLAAFVGISIGFLVVAAPKNSLVLWIGTVLVVLGAPVAVIIDLHQEVISCRFSSLHFLEGFICSDIL